MIFILGADVNRTTEDTQETARMSINHMIIEYENNHDLDVCFVFLVTLACAGGFVDVVKILIEHEAKVDIGQSTPLMEASQEGHLELVQYLIGKGAEVNQKSLSGEAGKFVYLCLFSIFHLLSIDL